jgi:hypothetical protein
MAHIPSARRLHAPAAGTGHRRHLYEGRTLCHRTGWVALSEDGVTCPGCRRRVERRHAAAAAARTGSTGAATWARAMLAFVTAPHAAARPAAE